MKPMAILCSDLHLSLKPPACRADKDWMQVQAYYLQQLKKISDAHLLPIFCAGDLFDRWNAPAELINFAFDELPDHMYCIPGQHDLPNHRIQDKHRSAYGVLARAGKIRDLSEPPGIFDSDDLLAFGFGFGQELPLSISKGKDSRVHLLLLHQFVYINEETAYPGASKDLHLKKLTDRISGYDAAAIGDNHKGWLRPSGGFLPHTDVMNCGAFIRRKSDEISYNPGIGILMDNGTIERRFFDTSIDKFHDNAKVREAATADIQAFIDELSGLGEHGLNFREAVVRHLQKESLDPKVKALILSALEGDNL